MPSQLSIFELVANASLLVQLVMLLLMVVSLVSWMMIFQKWFLLRRALNEYEAFEDHFWSGIDLRQFYNELETDEALNGIESIFVSGFKEFLRLSEQSEADPEAVMQGVQRAMRVALNREVSRLETNLAFLATVGSTSPYVGLFGTVLGVIDAFQGIGISGITSLAAVAPGISEALIATAAGLLAAIPALMAFNHYRNKVRNLGGQMRDFSLELTNRIEWVLYEQLAQSGK